MDRIILSFSILLLSLSSLAQGIEIQTNFDVRVKKRIDKRMDIATEADTASLDRLFTPDWYITTVMDSGHLLRLHPTLGWQRFYADVDTSYIATHNYVMLRIAEITAGDVATLGGTVQGELDELRGILDSLSSIDHNAQEFAYEGLFDPKIILTGSSSNVHLKGSKFLDVTREPGVGIFHFGLDTVGLDLRYQAAGGGVFIDPADQGRLLYSNATGDTLVGTGVGIVEDATTTSLTIPQGSNKYFEISGAGNEADARFTFDPQAGGLMRVSAGDLLLDASGSLRFESFQDMRFHADKGRKFIFESEYGYMPMVLDSYASGLRVGFNTTAPRADFDINHRGSMIVPSGLTNERQDTIEGMLRHSLDKGKFEVVEFGTQWENLATERWVLEQPFASGSSGVFIDPADQGKLLYPNATGDTLLPTYLNLSTVNGNRTEMVIGQGDELMVKGSGTEGGAYILFDPLGGNQMRLKSQKVLWEMDNFEIRPIKELTLNANAGHVPIQLKTQGVTSLHVGSANNGRRIGFNTATPRADFDINHRGSMIVPSGLTNERQDTIEGMLRHSLDKGKFEVVEFGTQWATLATEEWVASQTSNWQVSSFDPNDVFRLNGDVGIGVENIKARLDVNGRILGRSSLTLGQSGVNTSGVLYVSSDSPGISAGVFTSSREDQQSETPLVDIRGASNYGSTFSAPLLRVHQTGKLPLFTVKSNGQTLVRVNPKNPPEHQYQVELGGSSFNSTFTWGDTLYLGHLSTNLVNVTDFDSLGVANPIPVVDQAEDPTTRRIMVGSGSDYRPIRIKPGARVTSITATMGGDNNIYRFFGFAHSVQDSTSAIDSTLYRWGATDHIFGTMNAHYMTPDGVNHETPYPFNYARPGPGPDGSWYEFSLTLNHDTKEVEYGVVKMPKDSAFVVHREPWGSARPFPEVVMVPAQNGRRIYITGMKRYDPELFVTTPLSGGGSLWVQDGPSQIRYDGTAKLANDLTFTNPHIAHRIGGEDAYWQGVVDNSYQIPAPYLQFTAADTANNIAGGISFIAPGNQSNTQISTGNIEFETGPVRNGGGTSGSIEMRTGESTSTGVTGSITLETGGRKSATNAPGGITLQTHFGGSGTNDVQGTSGDITLTTREKNHANGTRLGGGNIYIHGGHRINNTTSQLRDRNGSVFIEMGKDSFQTASEGVFEVAGWNDLNERKRLLFISPTKSTDSPRIWEAGAVFENTPLGVLVDRTAIKYDLHVGGTGASKLSSGTTLQRPSTGELGLFRGNTDSLAAEFHDGIGWRQLAFKDEVAGNGLWTQTGPDAITYSGSGGSVEIVQGSLPTLYMRNSGSSNTTLDIHSNADARTLYRTANGTLRGRIGMDVTRNELGMTHYNSGPIRLRSDGPINLESEPGVVNFSVTNTKITSKIDHVFDTKIGIGTTAPTSPLDVNGTARIRSLPVGAATGLVGHDSLGNLISTTAGDTIFTDYGNKVADTDYAMDFYGTTSLYGTTYVWGNIGVVNGWRSFLFGTGFYGLPATAQNNFAAGTYIFPSLSGPQAKHNTGFGADLMNAYREGNNNTLFGSDILEKAVGGLTTGGAGYDDGNFAAGFLVGNNVRRVKSSVLIGGRIGPYHAGRDTTMYHTIALGEDALYDAYEADSIVALGYRAGVGNTHKQVTLVGLNTAATQEGEVVLGNYTVGGVALATRLTSGKVSFATDIQPTDGQGWVYSAAQGEYVPGTPPGGSGGDPSDEIQGFEMLTESSPTINLSRPNAENDRGVQFVGDDGIQALGNAPGTGDYIVYINGDGIYDNLELIDWALSRPDSGYSTLPVGVRKGKPAIIRENGCEVNQYLFTGNGWGYVSNLSPHLRVYNVTQTGNLGDVTLTFTVSTSTNYTPSFVAGTTPQGYDLTSAVPEVVLADDAAYIRTTVTYTLDGGPAPDFDNFSSTLATSFCDGTTGTLTITATGTAANASASYSK